MLLPALNWKAGNSVTLPVVEILPTRLKPFPRTSVNHKSPSDPAVMPAGLGQQDGDAGYSVTIPVGVIFPIFEVPVNQTFPSAPAAKAITAVGLGRRYSVISPTVVIFPTAPFPFSFLLNHKLPSGP